MVSPPSGLRLEGKGVGAWREKRKKAEEVLLFYQRPHPKIKENHVSVNAATKKTSHEPEAFRVVPGTVSLVLYNEKWRLHGFQQHIEVLRDGTKSQSNVLTELAHLPCYPELARLMTCCCSQGAGQLASLPSIPPGGPLFYIANCVYSFTFL